MNCPKCGYHDTKVLETRESDDGTVIRRRRECNSCHERFTTFERIEKQPFWVIKKDGSREPFDVQKILAGMLRACEKRPVSIETLERSADAIERDLRINAVGKEVSTLLVGEKVMNCLKNLDAVAYVRFASVYREFKDIDTFLTEIQDMMHTRN